MSIKIGRHRAGVRTLAGAALFAALTMLHGVIHAQAVSDEDALWNAAKARADRRIDAFEQTLRTGDAARIRAAALTVQADPIAVQMMNKTRTDALKTELNGVLGDIREQTKQEVRQQVAREQGVRPEQVQFFEATNPSDEIKVGQDWDVTVRVETDNTLDTANRASGERAARSVKDLRVEDTQDIVHRAYYQAATGKPAESLDDARELAHRQAVEVINYQGAEAYGRSVAEGNYIITGPKDQQLADPAQVAKAMEHKSNLPAQRAAKLEAQASALESAAAEFSRNGDSAGAELLRAQALEKRLDAQGQKLEQGRQFTKQMQKQVVPRLGAMGMTVPSSVLEATAIMREMENLESSPAQVREKLLSKKLGTPETVINKGAGMIELAQKSRAGTAGGAPRDVFTNNVEDKLEVDKARRAKWTGDEGGQNAPAGTAGGKSRDKGRPAPEPRTGTSSFVDQRGLDLESFDEQVSQNTRTAGALNVALNVSQFFECMQGAQAAQARPQRATECLTQQALSLALDQATDAAVGAATSTAAHTLNFYFPSYYARFAPGIGMLGTVVLAAHGAHASGQQVHEAYVEGRQWWDALNTEQRAQAGSDALEHRNMRKFAHYLLRREQSVRKQADTILEERRSLGRDLARLEREQASLLAGLPRDFETRLNDYLAQAQEAKRRCESGVNSVLAEMDSSQSRLRELMRSQAMTRIRSCRDTDELRQADSAWQRAMAAQDAPAADKTETLLNEAPLWGNMIKQMKADAARIKSEKQAIPGRIAALTRKIDELRSGQTAFMDTFPPELLDVMKRNSGRIQALQVRVDAIGGLKGIDDPLGLRKLQSAHQSLDKDAAKIDAALEGFARHTGNFHYLVDTLVYDIARCRGRQTGKAGEGAQDAQADATAYQSLRKACAAKVGAPPAPAGEQLPRVIKPSAETIAGWQKGLACLREGKRKTTYWVDCNGTWTNGSRDKAISDLEELLRRNGVDPTDHSAPPPVAAGVQASVGRAAGTAGMASVSGSVTVRSATGEAGQLAGGAGVPYGASIATAAGAQLSFVSEGGTTVTVAPGSTIRMHAAAAPGGRSTVEILGGGIEVKRPAGAPGSDDIGTRTRDAEGHAEGTHYKVTLTERGTTYQVFEGRIVVRGAMLTKTDAAFQVRGKTAFQKEMRLGAGEYGIAFSTMRDERFSEAATPASPVPAVEPWDDPRIMQLIDQWLREATPAVRADLPGPWRFTEWGQVLGPGSKATGAPDHPSGWSRHRSLWAKRMQFDSLNLCSMGEYVERRLAGKGLEGCAKAAPAAPALPSWVKPGVPPAGGAPATASKPAELIANARAELERAAAQPQPAPSPVPIQRTADIPAARPAPPRFTGAWECTITHPDGRTAQSRHQVTQDRDGNYWLHLGSVEVQFAARYVQGNKIGFLVGNGTTEKDIYLDLVVRGDEANGTDRVEFRDGRTLTYDMRCRRQSEKR